MYNGYIFNVYLSKRKSRRYRWSYTGRNIAGHVNSEEGKTVEDFGKELDSLLADW